MKAQLCVIRLYCLLKNTSEYCINKKANLKKLFVKKMYETQKR